METWLGQLSDSIIREFHIGDRKNMAVKARMGEGFSGAEVYLVELKGSSAIKGSYYLKIDQEADEYENNRNSFCFSRAVKCVEKREIRGYYVMLLEIAGKSILEYQKFHSIYRPSIKTGAVRKMAGEMLAEATDGREIVGEDLCPCELFRAQLKQKLAPGSPMGKFLAAHLPGEDAGNIFSIQMGKETLPNAFAYAVNDRPWEGKRIPNMTCPIHGDLHGGNVFVSHQTCEYAVIDMAYYRNDGWIFFDTAYFEFNLMLHNLKREPLERWLFSIRQVAGQVWEEVDFKDGKVVRAIAEGEQEWIERKVTDRFNYLDQLRMARILARVLAGLNYAGKKEVPEDNRYRAYLFACCYLIELLRMAGINPISTNICTWEQAGVPMRKEGEI